MKRFTLAGLCRFILAVSFCWLLHIPAGEAAAIRWEALADRERLTLDFEFHDPVPGVVGRIDTNALILPFAEVPSGLIVAKAPEGAMLFQGTRQYGRALLITTQTPEFGFMMVKRTPKQVIVDLFSDPLGARWRPTDKAPTTEMAPGHAPLPEIAEIPAVQRQTTPEAPGAITGKINAEPVPTPETDPRAAAATPETAPPVTPDPAPTATPGTTPAVTPAAPQPPEAAQNNPVPPATQVEPGYRQTPPEPAPASSAVFQPMVPFTGTPGVEGGGNFPLPEPQPPASGYSETQPGKTAATPGQTPDGQPPDKQTSGSQTPGGKAQSPPPGETLPTVQTSPAAPPAITPVAPAAAPVQPVTPTPPAGETSATGSPAGPFAASGETAQNDRIAPITAKGSPPADGRIEVPYREFSLEPPDDTSSIWTPEQKTTSDPALAFRARVEELGPNGETNTISRSGASGRGRATSAPADSRPQSNQPQAGRSRVNQPQAASAQADSRPQAAQAQNDHAQDGRPIANATPGTPSTPPAVPQASREEIVAAPPATAEAPAANATEQVIVYVDEQGNPVEPPADPAAKLYEIKILMGEKRLKEALEAAENLLRQTNLLPEQREEALHIKAETLFNQGRDNLAENYQAITDATVTAMNFNNKSDLNAGALLRLGYMNLKLNNIPEAEARFNMLRRQFPDHESIPLTYYYWGDYFYGRGEYMKAADEFQFILQNHHDSRYAREAAVALTRTFYRLEYNEQAYNVANYIETRWPRFYLEHPPFLSMLGDIAMRLDKREEARAHYLLYYNIVPTGPEADVVLTRIGDLYSLDKQMFAAKAVYSESVRRFPDKDGGLVAMMRLAEESVNDNPSVTSMFSVFGGPHVASPVETYLNIIDKHPDSRLAPLAQLKLAMWYLWDRQFINALEIATDLVTKYPDSDLAPRARDVALRAYSLLGSESIKSERFNQLAQIWEKYPIVREQEDKLEPESRIALAWSFLNAGRPEEALSAIDSFFLGAKVPEYSEMALQLALKIYMEFEQWQTIREVARRVELWELTPNTQRQLHYAEALVAENLNEPEVAAPLWQKLYADPNLSPRQAAFAAFFLARNAEKNRDMEQAWNLGQDALSRLLIEAQKDPQSADTPKILAQLGSLMDIAETAGRLREATQYGEQYITYLADGSPEKASVLYRMARIVKRQGNEQGWRDILTNISQNYADTVYGQTAAAELKNARLAEDAARFSPTGPL